MRSNRLQKVEGFESRLAAALSRSPVLLRVDGTQSISGPGVSCPLLRTNWEKPGKEGKNDGSEGVSNGRRSAEGPGGAKNESAPVTPGAYFVAPAEAKGCLTGKKRAGRAAGGAGNLRGGLPGCGVNGPRHNFPKSTRKHRLASGGVSRRESNRTKATNKILYAHWRLEEEAIRQAAERRKATAEKQRRRERCRAREAEREKKGGVEVGEAKKKSLKTPSAQAVEAKGEEVKRGEQERVRQSVGDCREEERRPFQMHAGGFSTPSCHCLLKQDAVPVGSPVPPAPVPPSGAETAPSLDSWRELEEGYRLSVLKGLMQCRQKRREAVAQYFAIQTQLLDTLYGEHMSVDGVPEDNRSEVDARPRHSGMKELRDALRQECNAGREESAREKAARFAEGCVGGHVADIARAYAELAQTELSHFLCTLPLLQSCHARRFGLQNPDLLPVLATPTGTPALPPEPSWVAAAPPAIASCARRALHALHTSRLALADVIYRTESKSTEARQQINEVAKGAERVSEAGEPKPSRKGDNVVANEGCESPGPAPEAAANPGVVARRECARAVLASLETEGTRAMGRLRQVAEEAAGDLEAVKETEAGTFELLDSWIAERIKVAMAAKSPLQAADPARSSAADVVAPINAAEDAVRAQQDTGSALAKATASQGTAAKAAADAKELWREEERTASGKATPGEEVGEAAVKIRCNKIHRAGCPASLVVQGDRDLRAGATSDRCERHSPLSDAEATAATNANADVRDAAVREYDAKAAAHFDPGVREPEGYAHVAALLGGEVGGFATCPLAAASRDAAARGTAAVRDAATRALAVPDAGPSATPSTSGAAPLDAAALSSVQMTSSTAEERASETQCCPVLRLRGGGPKRRSKDSEDEWDTGSETDDSDEMSIEEESQESEEEEVGEAMDGGYENEEEEGRETASEEQFDGKAVETSSESASGCSEDSEEDMEVESPVAVGGANEGSEDDSDPEGKTPLLSTDEPDAAGTDFQTPRSLPGTPDQGAREDSGVFSPESLSQALSDVQAQIEGAPHKPSPRKPARKRRNTRTEVESRDETSDGTPENEAAHRVIQRPRMARNGDLSWSLRSAMGTEERAQREGGRQTRCTSLEIGKEVLAQSAMAAQDAEERTDDWRERPNTKAGRDEQGQQESGREAAARVESSRDARAARRSDRTERAQREGGDLHERAHDTILPEEDTTSRREERAQRGAGRGSRQVSGEAGVRGGEGAASAEGESEDGEREVGDNECGRNEGGRRERARARSSVRAAEEAGEPRARAAPRAVGGQNAVEDSNDPAVDEVEIVCDRLRNLKLVQNARRLLEEGDTKGFMQTLRAVSFLVGDGRLCAQGIRLGTKSTDWPMHLSIHEVAKKLNFVPAETEAYLQFLFFRTREVRGRARLWEACCSKIDSKEMATDICTLFGADIQTKSQHFTIPSPAVLARLFDEDPRLLLCLIFCGFSQGEGCLRKCRPSAVAKYPVVDFVSASAAAIFSLESFDKRCLGVTTGTVTITTAAAEADNVFTEDAEDEPEVTDAEVEAVENGTETERKRRVRYAQLTDAEERRGVRMLLRVACASGARRADETIEALRRWQRKIGADEVVVEDSEGEEETWSKQLVRGLARRAADRFAYDRPLTYRLVMRVVITELEKVYLEGAGEGRKVMYRLQYIAKYDVLKLAIVAVMGTTFEDAVIRKLAAFVKWATSFREVGEGLVDVLETLAVYREGIIPFARRNYDIGPDSLSTLEAQQKWLQQLKKKLITWKQYKKLAGVSSSSSVSARRKKEQIVSTLESDAVYWQQRSNLWDQELNERIHEHEKRFFVPNGTEFDPQVVKEALQQRPEQLGLFLRSGAAICSELPITTSQCEEGETVYLIEEQWLTDVTTWLIDDEPVSPPPSPTQYEGTDCPLLLGVDSTAFVVTSYQLAVLEAVFEFEDFDRQKLPQVQVSTGAGSKGGTAADLRPLSIWEVRLRTPDGLVTKRREVWVSTSLTMEQLRAQTKDWCCAGEKVDQTDYFGTLDWTTEVTLVVDGAPVGVARSVAFNSGQTLGVFIEKGLKTAMGENERPHCRDWTRVGLIVVGEEKAPPGVPPALRAAVESSRGEARAGVEAGVDGAGADGAGGVGAGLDGPQAAGEQWKVHAEFNWTYAGTWRQQLESEKQATQWEKWVELNTRNLLAMKEQLERAQSLGLPNVEVNRVQVEAILEAIAQMIRAIRGKLGENEKKIEIEIRALGTPLMRAVELLLTWAEVDPDSDDWVFDTVLFNQLEEGAWLCRGCGSANFGDPLDEEPERARLCECARAAQVPKGRGASEPRLETKADSEGSFPVVEWNTANTGGHSLVIARKTLASLHCIRWDPDNLSRQRGERVAFRWPGPEEEAEGPVTALQVAALVWSVLFNAGAAKYVEWKMTKKSKKERST